MRGPGFEPGHPLRDGALNPAPFPGSATPALRISLKRLYKTSTSCLYYFTPQPKKRPSFALFLIVVCLITLMLLGELVLSAMCDLFGESTYAILRKILEKMDLDDELAVYGLAYMYGVTMFEEGDKIKIKRKLACIELDKLAKLEAKGDRVYIRKPSPQEANLALKRALYAVTTTLKSLIGEAINAFLSYIANRLAKAFRGPNEIAIRISSELSRNPYAPKVSVEIEGRKIIVYNYYPIEINEEFLQGTIIPYILAIAAALMLGYKGVKLKESYIVDKNTIMMIFEAYR